MHTQVYIAVGILRSSPYFIFDVCDSPATVKNNNKGLELMTHYAMQLIRTALHVQLICISIRCSCQAFLRYNSALFLFA